MTSQFDVHAAREQFPTIASQPQIFLDNAGGSQTLGIVADSIKRYLTTHNVQLGASYKVSVQSTDAVDAGIAAAARWVNARPDEIVIGASTTQLLRNLSLALLPKLAKHPSPEIVVSTLDHEANIASWVALGDILPHAKIIHWTPRTPTADNPHLTPASLKPLLSSNTVLVTCTHASNVLGSVTDIRALADEVHTVPGAMLCVDGVALAPHRRIDMRALGVDFYAFSWYKVYGPHVAQIYARREAQDQALASLGHYFKAGHVLEEKLGLAGASYELAQSLPECVAYLESLDWDGVVAHEARIAETLLAYLRSKPETYRIFGEETGDARKRVPVVSFIVKWVSPEAVVAKVEAKTDFGFRASHFYSKRLTDDVLGLDDEGVVRVSMLHYNTVEEIEGLVKALDNEVLGGA